MFSKILERIKFLLTENEVLVLLLALNSDELISLARKLGIGFSGFRIESVPSDELATAIISELFQHKESATVILESLDKKLGSTGLIDGLDERGVDYFIKKKLKKITPFEISCLLWELLKKEWNIEEQIDKIFGEMGRRTKKLQGIVEVEKDEYIDEIELENETLHEENKQLHEEIKKLRHKEIEIESIKQQLRNKIEKKENELQDNYRKNENLQKEITNLKIEIENLKKRISDEKEIQQAKEFENKFQQLQDELYITKAKLENLVNLKRVGVFVDERNIYYSTKEIYGRKLDYKKLLEKIAHAKDRFIAGAYIYLVDNPEIEQLSFKKYLESIGFEIKSRELIERLSGSKKANWDIGLAIDILKMVNRFDIIVIVSGDSDFIDLIRYLRKYHEEIKIEIAAVPSREKTSYRLVKEADGFHEITHDMLIKY